MKNIFPHKVIIASGGDRIERKVLVFRTLVVFSLITTACLCGVFSYIILSREERLRYESNYESITSKILNTVKDRVRRCYVASNELSLVQSTLYPNASMWPNAHVPRYDNFNQNMQYLSDTIITGIAPLVRPEEVVSFEEYALGVFTDDPSYPPNAGCYDFGCGIYAINDSSGEMYHDMTGEVTFSDLDLILPVINVGEIDKRSSALLFNVHSEAIRAAAFDRSYICAEETSDICREISDIMQLITADSENEPNSLIVQPVYPRFNPDEIVGFVLVSISWLEIISNLLPDTACGLVAVLSSPSQEITYSICGSKVVLQCIGDCHDTEFDGHVVRDKLIPEGEEDHNYSLHIYPNKSFYDEYHTESPLHTSLGAVFVIFITSVIFISYDYFVKKESNEKFRVLEAKRKFVSFLCHEIRTPLNTVVLGLKLLKSCLEEEKQTICKVDGTANSKGLCESLELADEIEESTIVAVSVLNDMLNYDKIETNALKLELRPVAVWRFFRESVRMFQIQADQVGVELRVRVGLVDLGVQLPGGPTGDRAEGELPLPLPLPSKQKRRMYPKLPSRDIFSRLPPKTSGNGRSADAWNGGNGHGDQEATCPRSNSDPVGTGKRNDVSAIEPPPPRRDSGTIESVNDHIVYTEMDTSNKDSAQTQTQTQMKDDGGGFGAVDYSRLFSTDLVIECDTFRLSQVVRNVVSNAIKFSKSGQSVNVTFSYSPERTTLGTNEAEDEEGTIYSTSWNSRRESVSHSGQASRAINKKRKRPVRPRSSSREREASSSSAMRPERGRTGASKLRHLGEKKRGHGRIFPAFPAVLPMLESVGGGPGGRMEIVPVKELNAMDRSVKKPKRNASQHNQFHAPIARSFDKIKYQWQKSFGDKSKDERAQVAPPPPTAATVLEDLPPEEVAAVSLKRARFDVEEGKSGNGSEDNIGENVLGVTVKNGGTAEAQEVKEENDEAGEGDGDDFVFVQTGWVLLTVEDQGPGISRQNQRKLFGEGVQFNPNQLQAGGGSGLGLHLSKSIAEMHGGRIGVHSEGEGLGSIFFVEIPAGFMARKARGGSPNLGQTAFRYDSNHSNLNSDPQSSHHHHGVGEKIHDLVRGVGCGPSTLLVPPSSYVKETGSARTDAQSPVKAPTPALGPVNHLPQTTGQTVGRGRRLPPLTHEGSKPPRSLSHDAQPSLSGALLGVSASAVLAPGVAPSGAGDPTGSGHASTTGEVPLTVAEGTSCRNIVRNSRKDAEERATANESATLRFQAADCADDRSFLFLPPSVAPAPASEVKQSAASDAAGRSPCDRKVGRGRLLIVDDVGLCRKMLRRTLERHNFHCDEAKSGQEAVNTVLAKGTDQISGSCYYDCILMDNQMPVMDGPVATAKLRSMGYRGLIVGVTGSVMPDEVKNYKEKGANYIFQKPFNLEDFLTKYEWFKANRGVADHI